MKHKLPWAAVATSVILSSPLLGQGSVFAATTHHQMRVTHVEINNKILSSPSAFTYNNTTYMPLFYVQQLLKSLKVTNHWNSPNWSITANYQRTGTKVLKAKSGSVNVYVNDKVVASHVDKQVAVDPASHQDTTYVPIWYIQMVLRGIGLDNTWNGTTWNVLVAYQDDSKTGDYIGSYSTMADAKNALLQYPGGSVQDLSGTVKYTEPSFKTVDLRYAAPTNVTASSLDTYLKNHKSIFAGLGQVFMAAQNTYGVNANYLVSHAMEESGSGLTVSPMALNKNNLYGYGAYDTDSSQAGTFPSEAYAILFQAWDVRNNYLNPGSSNYGGSPTLNGMSASYASDKEWANKINNLMNQLALDLNDNITSYHQYSQTDTTPVPASSSLEPVFKMNGATGTVQTDGTYGVSIPVYQDAISGDEHMFGTTLVAGNAGPAVKTLQQVLNDEAGTQLTVDGKYGQNTQTAVEAFQTAHGLTPTGECDFKTWSALSLTDSEATINASQSVQIDAMEQGMVGNVVTEWVHVMRTGWVDANDVSFNNVYRLTVPNLTEPTQAEIAVKTTTGSTVYLHVGDEIEATSANVGQSHPTIQFVDELTGQSVTGTIESQGVTLTKV